MVTSLAIGCVRILKTLHALLSCTHTRSTLSAPKDNANVSMSRADEEVRDFVGISHPCQVRLSSGKIQVILVLFLMLNENGIVSLVITSNLMILSS